MARTTGVAEDAFLMMAWCRSVLVFKGGRPAKREQPQHGPPVALGFQLLGRALHEEGVPVVYRVARLKDEHSIGTELLEPGLQQRGRQALHVHAVVVVEVLQDAGAVADEPIARLVDHLDVRMPARSSFMCWKALGVDIVETMAPSVPDSAISAAPVRKSAFRSSRPTRTGKNGTHRKRLPTLLRHRDLVRSSWMMVRAHIHAVGRRNKRLTQSSGSTQGLPLILDPVRTDVEFRSRSEPGRLSTCSHISRPIHISRPSISAFFPAVHAFTMGTSIGTTRH